MPSVIEARVATARKIPYQERDLAQVVADFYLLETLGYVHQDRQAKKNLAVFESKLAKEFSAYLDIAVGGELRYARSMLGDDCPRQLEPFLREAAMADRGTAWLAWGVIRRAWGISAIELAEQTFEMAGWRGAFGGEAWASIASVLRAYLEGRINDRIFVDRVVSLEHNSGSCLNKLYNTRDLKPVLDAHGNDEYNTLLKRASKEVRLLWTRQEIVTRIQHDPAWLGVQPMYGMNDVGQWEMKYGWEVVR